MLVIVDYGLGNLASILNMCRRVGIKAVISSDKSVIEQAGKLILPGVGSFDHGMNNLIRLELVDTLRAKVLEARTPVLGICLGAQLMTSGSEEGLVPGLGWIEADTVRFRQPANGPSLKIPHMGWTDVKLEKQSGLFADMYDNPRFYFVHSYHFNCHQGSDILTTSVYGDRFTSAFARENIVGVQFHPEKSHKFGMKLLQNFVQCYGQPL